MLSLIYFLDSTINLIPVRSSPSTSTSAKAGIHTKSTPAGATNPLAIATAFTAWFRAPAPIACISALFDSFTNPAIAPATELGFDFDEIFKSGRHIEYIPLLGFSIPLILVSGELRGNQ